MKYKIILNKREKQALRPIFLINNQHQFHFQWQMHLNKKHSQIKRKGHAYEHAPSFCIPVKTYNKLIINIIVELLLNNNLPGCLNSCCRYDR